jgi:hemerythrin-like domain-containing protein
MEAYMNKGIKEIINAFPAIEVILNEYQIGCGPCMVGTCLLKDIVKIHNLSEEQEQEMIARIAQVIYPDQAIKIEKTKPRPKPGVRLKEIKCSPPMKELVDEHVWIKRFIALIPQIIQNTELDTNGGMRLIRNCIDFIRQYADRFHHAKEEDILFKYFDESSDILKAMHEDHKNARAHVSAIIGALERKDKEIISEHLKAYGLLLSEHIRKEDEILYPWMDRMLSTTQIGKLHEKFYDVKKNASYSPAEYEKFVQSLEATYACV